MTYECAYCGAIFWFDERLSSYPKTVYPKYSLCCTNGKIQLPLLKRPPPFLNDLINGTSAKSKHYLENIRTYNNMFSFTSMGGKIDHSMNTGNGPPVFQLHGQNYHLIGSLLPPVGEMPKFAQLYIYDTDNEIQNRIGAVRYVVYYFKKIKMFIKFYILIFIFWNKFWYVISYTGKQE